MNKNDPKKILANYLEAVLDNRDPLPPASVRKTRIEFFIQADQVLTLIEKTLPNSVERERRISEYEKLSSNVGQVFGKDALEAISWLNHWVETNTTIYGAFNHFPRTNVFDKYSWIILYHLSKIAKDSDKYQLMEIGSVLATRLDRLDEWDQDGKAHI